MNEYVSVSEANTNRQFRHAKLTGQLKEPSMTKASTPKTFVASAANVAFASTIVQQLNSLSQKRMTWEATDFKKANDGLYDLLGECLDTYLAKFVNASDDDRKTLRRELVALLKVAGVHVQNNTSTLTMFVRYVFGSDRKRAHGYAYVLMAAISHDITGAGLPDWIRQSHGIEEIKRNSVKSAGAIARVAQLETAQVQVKADIETAAITPLAQVDIALTGQYAVLLAMPNADGTTAIIGALPDITPGLFNGLLKRMARIRVQSNMENAQLGKEGQDLLAAKNSAAQKQQLAA
jgi:hypothetical protein